MSSQLGFGSVLLLMWGPLCGKLLSWNSFHYWKLVFFFLLTLIVYKIWEYEYHKKNSLQNIIMWIVNYIDSNRYELIDKQSSLTHDTSKNKKKRENFVIRSFGTRISTWIPTQKNWWAASNQVRHIYLSNQVPYIYLSNQIKYLI